MPGASASPGSDAAQSRGPSAAAPATPPRRRRADAQRNVASLLDAAREVFHSSGVDAPVKEIADRAGVGVGTLYRHFPKRSDLVRAVFQQAVDECAAEGPALAAAHEPGEALTRWVQRYTEFLATKRGLASALHSGDPAFEALPDYFLAHLEPTLAALLDAARASGAVRSEISAKDLLYAVASLCAPAADAGADYTRRTVGLLLDGLRAGAEAR